MIVTGPRLRSLFATMALSASIAGCSKLTGLPEIPASVTRKDAGLEGIERLSSESRDLARPVEAAERAQFAAAPPTGVVDRARAARDVIEQGDAPSGLARFAEVVESAPADLVIGNAFRIQVYRLKRDTLAAARGRGERSPLFPEFLRGEPLATLKRVNAKGATRELRVQLALAHVDQMVLDPALEVRAPASIDSVHAFTAALDEDPYYVPALVGRGLNHLNRPRHLVWPEHPAPPADAASRDFAAAAAVGAKLGGASRRVKGFLLLLLGDAYAHEGNPGIARSWWTLAGESTDDRAVHDELRVRAGWPETEMPDRLEARLEARMNDMDTPVSDLSFFWDDAARGPF